MPDESILRQKSVHGLDGTARVMSGACLYQRVIHKVGIAKVRLSSKETLSIRQMKSGEKETQGRSPWNALHRPVRLYMSCNGGTCERSGDGVSYCYLREFEELLSRRSQVRILQGAPFKINALRLPEFLPVSYSCP